MWDGLIVMSQLIDKSDAMLSSQSNLPSDLKVIPRHVAIIMDGNGRWARQRGRIRIFGHRNAISAVRMAVETSRKIGVESLTLFAFSSENWRRPKREISYLMGLFKRFLVSETPELHKQGIRIKVVGDLSRFSPELQADIKKSEELTTSNDKLNLNIAANYGGRWDIVNACKKLASEGFTDWDSLTEEKFAENLSTSNSEVDLMIRTGGEIRISNFLIWQLAYAELYMTDVMWPDFSEAEFIKALQWYSSRERRFGCTGEQVRKSLEKENNK